MDTGLDGALRQFERGRDLGVGQTVHVAQHDRRSLAPWQPREAARPDLDLAATFAERLDRRRGVARVETGVHERGEAHGRSPFGRAPSSVAARVHGDRRQPRSQGKLTDPLDRVRHEGAICPHERVLGGLLRIRAIPQDSQCDREDAVLVGGHEPRERSVNVACQADCQFAVVHHHQNTPRAGMVARRASLRRDAVI